MLDSQGLLSTEDFQRKAMFTTYLQQFETWDMITAFCSKFCSLCFEAIPCLKS